MSIRITRSLAVAATCAAIAACSKGENKVDSAAVADSIAKATAAAPPAAPAPAPLTDANIVAILDGANATDSSAGKVATEKGTSAAVKDFGKMMMHDHHALRKAGQDLATKLKVTPQAPAGDNSQATAQAWHDSLTAMAKGAAWDKAYIDHEVAYHQAVLSTAQTALGAAQDSSLKALITKAAPNIQAHLTKAQDLQTKLGAAKP